MEVVRWAFVEFCDVYEIGTDFSTKVEVYFNDMISKVALTEEAAMAATQGGKN